MTARTLRKKSIKKGITKKEQQRIFITGGLGYIGSAFAKEALKKGYAVALYDSLIYEQDPQNILQGITGKKSNQNITYIIGDTRNVDLLERSIVEFQPTFVLHLAELSSVYSCNHNPPYTEDINYRASKKVLDVCEKLSIPVLYNSTSSLYGNQAKMRLMKEDDVLPEPTDYYCTYKLKMEAYIKQKVKKNPKFKIIVFRPATVYGLAPRMRLELLPNHFTYLAVAKGVIRISELGARRAAISLQELTAGYFKVIEKGNWKHLVYNIGHHNMSKKEFAVGIQRIVTCELGSITDIGDLRNLQTDNSRFNTEFKFRPTTPYEETIKSVAVWVRSNLKVIEGSNYAGIINMSVAKWKELI